MVYISASLLHILGMYAAYIPTNHLKCPATFEFGRTYCPGTQKTYLELCKHTGKMIDFVNLGNINNHLLEFERSLQKSEEPKVLTNGHKGTVAHGRQPLQKPA